MTHPTDMREHILEVANRLFYQHGLRAVGVDRVIAESGIAKATLYRHFPTKELLMATYLKRRSEAALRAIRSELGTLAPNPTVQIGALFERLARVLENGFRGCAFIRALSEHLESETIRSEVKAHKDATKALIGELLAPLPIGAAQQLELRDTLSLLYEGALSSGLVYQDIRNVLTAKRAALALLALADPPARSERPSRATKP